MDIYIYLFVWGIPSRCRLGKLLPIVVTIFGAGGAVVIPMVVRVFVNLCSGLLVDLYTEAANIGRNRSYLKSDLDAILSCHVPTLVVHAVKDIVRV